jgi:CRISPR system Cascade subunit CasC
VSNEIDFFSAVDDLKPEDAEDAGAGMTGTLEFNSATYYRFAALNLDMLEDKEHLGGLAPDERREVVRMFVRATLTAMPAARRNSMHAATLPSFVLAVVREKGHPVQLVNAFEEPVWTRGGLAEASRKKLEEEYARLTATWDIAAVAECRMPDMPLGQLLDEVARHVR